MRTLWNFLIELWNWNEPTEGCGMDPWGCPTIDEGCGFDPWGCPKGS